MASFVGTNKEFRRYIGPMLRNLVQQFTRKHKAEISACEHCGTRESLESAHVHGKDRNEIIDLMLNEHTHNGIATVNIGTFEERFKEQHHPLEESILILCRNCHKKYDSKAPKSNSVHQAITQPHDQLPCSANSKVLLPITLEPPDPTIFKRVLLRSRRAEIETTYSDGRVEQKPWNASRFSRTSNVFGNLRSRPEYRAGSWQSRGIIKVHVKAVKNA